MWTPTKTTQQQTVTQPPTPVQWPIHHSTTLNSPSLQVAKPVKSSKIADVKPPCSNPGCPLSSWRALPTRCDAFLFCPTNIPQSSFSLLDWCSKGHVRREGPEAGKDFLRPFLSRGQGKREKLDNFRLQVVTDLMFHSQTVFQNYIIYIYIRLLSVLRNFLN